MRRLFWAAGLCMGLAAWAAEPLPQLSLRIEAGSPVRVGDRISFTIEGAPEKFELRNPDPQGNLLDLGWAFDRTSDGELFLIPVKPGGMLPSFQVWDVESQPGRAVATTRAEEIQVEGLAKTEAQPAPMVPPQRLPLPWTLVAILVFLIAWVLVGMLLGGRWAWRKWCAYRSKQRQGPPKTEDEEALDSLAQLLQEGLIAKGKYKPHYYRASDILKKYLGRRYDFDALESTSHEVVARMEDGKLADDRVVDRVEKLFEKLDLVKFTDFIPSAEEAQQLVEEVRSLVKTTRRVPVVGEVPQARPKR